MREVLAYQEPMLMNVRYLKWTYGTFFVSNSHNGNVMDVWKLHGKSNLEMRMNGRKRDSGFSFM